MYKDDKHRTKGLISQEKEIELDRTSNLYRFVASIQEEVHNYAISYHRSLRNKSLTKSELDDIQGIGEKRKKALLNHFKDIEAIKKATFEELLEVVLKLVIAFLIKALNPDIRLAIYGLLLVGVSGISFLSYLVVVKAKYKWKMGGQFDRNLFKEMLSFASWNLFGSAIFSFKNQAVNIVINQNFNAGIVTARGIATSIYSALAKRV